MYRVLIVEDEEIIRKGLAFMMDWTKVDCVVVGDAADGAEGIEKIHSLQPDIVVTDIRMPVKDGLEMLAEALAETSFYAIVLSGYSDFQYAQQAIRLGVKDYLLKPVDFDELAACIQRIQGELERARLRTASSGEPILEQASLNRYTSRRVGALLNEIKEGYPQRLSLQELGIKYQMSPSYLNTQFKKETGYTFNDFLNRYRILMANELLQQQPTLKIYEVADRVGFSDYKYFIKVFKKYVGYPPLEVHRRFDGQPPVFSGDTDR